jgi:uncharacterized membrane protein YdjX (TVP38/TMEM64 family)
MFDVPPPPPDGGGSEGLPFYMWATLFFFVNIIIWLVIGWATGTPMWLVLLIMFIFLAVGGGVMWFFVRRAEKEHEKDREWWE